jgi:hypothetical protein
MVATVRVDDVLTLDQIDLAAKYGLEFRFHRVVVVKVPVRAILEDDQDIDIAVWPKVVRRTEPKRENSLIRHLRQKSPMRSGEMGTWALMLTIFY